MKVRPEQLRLYAVTDRAWAADEDAFLAQVNNDPGNIKFQ